MNETDLDVCFICVYVTMLGKLAILRAFYRAPKPQNLENTKRKKN